MGEEGRKGWRESRREDERNDGKAGREIEGVEWSKEGMAISYSPLSLSCTVCVCVGTWSGLSEHVHHHHLGHDIQRRSIHSERAGGSEGHPDIRPCRRTQDY